ncbi:hypothetical protein ACG3RT_07030 [Pseudomonas aeruginosa]|uniref:PIN domain-containing protein n=1 Tax=Pseudomonas aeruginosa TaxID=287 RepID=UPI00208EA62B
MALINEGNDVKADNQSLAIGGDVNAPVTVVYQNGLSQAELAAAFKIAITDSGLVSALPNSKELEWHSEIEKLIDEYANQREQGQVKTIQALFENLLASQASNLNGHLIYRLKANIAICLHLQGKNSEAAKLMHEACSHSPEEPKSQANKVLAYLLDNQSVEAYRFGLDRLKETPNNENVAAYTIQAARVSQTLPDPYPGFCEEVKESALVQAAHIEFLQSRGDISWKELARSAHEKHSDGKHLSGLAAQSYLDDIVRRCNSKKMAAFDKQNLEKINKAREFFESEWDELKRSDRAVRPADYASLCNLLICYNLLSEKAKATELCRFLLAHCADDNQSIELAIQSALDFGASDVFQEALPLLKTEGLRYKYKFIRSVHHADWSELAKIQDYQLERADPELKPFMTIACYLAQAALRKAEGKRKLEKYLAETALDKQARTLLFDLSLRTELSPIIQIAFEYGLAQVNKDSDLDERILYCRIARKIGGWRVIINLLKEGTLSDEDSEGSRILALAYINDYPIREDAVKFFEGFVVQGVAENYHNLLSGLFATKRQDFKKAKTILTQYLENGGVDASAMLALADICHLESDIAFLTELLHRYSLGSLEGTPEQRMHLAKLTTKYVDAGKGLSYGYSLYEENPKDSAVALGYAHLLLSLGNKIDIEHTDTVAASVFFKLENDAGEIVERLVPGNIDDLLELSPDGVDVFIKLSLGLKVGESFTRPKFHLDIKWTVKEIQHKYLRAFRHITANFETEFPGVQGFWSMKMEKDDIQPLLDFIKKAAEKDESIINDLTQRRVPIEIISAMWKKRVIQVAGLVRKYKSEIYTCHGNIDERQLSYKILEGSGDKGLVLDTYTASVAGFIGLIPILQKAFGKIYISNSTITELQYISTDVVGSLGSELSIDWHNGHFYKNETSREQKESGVESIQGCINALKEYCEIITYDFPENLDQTIDKIFDIIGPTPFEPYFIAIDKEAIFISDDGYSREYAKVLHQIEKSAWLQSALDVAAERLGITLDEYSGYIVSLAQHRHSHLSLNFEAFERIYQLDSSNELYEFRSVAQYIGIKNAEVRSHYELTRNFLINRWVGRKRPDLKTMKATGILLESFTRIPQTLELVRGNFNISSIELSEYIQGWMDGHFLRFT